MRSQPAHESQSAARGVAAVASAALKPIASIPARIRFFNASRPPKRRRLPATSRSSACGGSSETLGVNWHAQAPIASSVAGGRSGKRSATQSMDRPFHRKDERYGGWSAAALEDAKRKFIRRRFQEDAQRRGRSVLRRLGRAKERHPRVARLGRHRKATQLVVAHARKPGYERMAACRTQYLFGRPERIAPSRRAHHHQLSEIDTTGGERGRVRKMRRREPDDALAGPRKRGHRRQHELQLADARAADQKLGQRPGGPAAARKLAVERIEAGGHRACQGRQPSAAPDWMPLENVVQCRHRCSVELEPELYLYTVSATMASLRNSSGE